MEATVSAPRSTLGRRIRRARMEMTMDQATFADKIGVSRRQVGKWELDQARPRTVYLDRIEWLTRKPAAWFLDGIPDEDL